MYSEYKENRDKESRKTIKRLIIFFVVLVLGFQTIGYLQRNAFIDYSRFNWELLTQVNYTGLPEDEDVMVYPENHIISGERFKIVFVNRRDEPMYWGSEWRAEKWVNGRYYYQKPYWAWTDELRGAGPHSFVVNGENFPFGDGLYRVTKRCMLNDNYDREKRRWEAEFIVQFFIFKQSN